MCSELPWPRRIAQTFCKKKDFPNRRMTIAESSAKVFHCHCVLVVTVVWATSFMISPDVTLRSWTCPSFRKGHYKIHINKSHYNIAKDVLGVFFKMYVSPTTKKGIFSTCALFIFQQSKSKCPALRKRLSEFLWADDHHTQYQRQTWPHSIWQPPFNTQLLRLMWPAEQPNAPKATPVTTELQPSIVLAPRASL